MSVVKSQALIYLRVSTGKQAAKELPIETQKTACLDLAHREGLAVDAIKDIYKDEVSGRKIAGRTGLQLLMGRIQQESSVSVVIIYDISRLSRNAIEYHSIKKLFQKHGVRLLSVNESLPSDDSSASWLMEFMLSGFAEFRSRQDGEKIKKSMRNKAESGGWCGVAPYGYKNVQEQVSSSKRKRWIEPSQTEAPWVTRIHELYGTGRYSIRDLTAKLHEEGMVLRRGRKLHKSNIEKILKNEAYIGVVNFADVRCEKGQHQPLVGKTLFRRNQTILKARRQGGSRKRRRFFFVRAFSPVCGECGSRWQGAFHTGRSGKKYGRYSCSKVQHGDTVSCSQACVPLARLDRELANLLSAIKLSPKALEALKAEIAKIVNHDEESKRRLRNTITAQQKAVKQKEDRLVDKYLEGKVPEAIYEEKMNECQIANRTLMERLEAMDSELEHSARVLKMALLLAQNLNTAFKKARLPELQSLLFQPLVETLTIREKAIESVSLRIPFDFLADLGPLKERFQLGYIGGPSETSRERGNKEPKVAGLESACADSRITHSQRTNPSQGVQELLANMPELIDPLQEVRLEQAIEALETLGFDTGLDSEEKSA